jgi:hypothetical protein
MYSIFSGRSCPCPYLIPYGNLESKKNILRETGKIHLTFFKPCERLDANKTKPQVKRQLSQVVAKLIPVPDNHKMPGAGAPTQFGAQVLERAYRGDSLLGLSLGGR